MKLNVLSISPSEILGPIKGIASFVAFLQSLGHLIFLAVCLKSPGLVLMYPSPLGPHALVPLYRQLATEDPKSSAAVPCSSIGSEPSSLDPAGDYSVFSLKLPS